MSVPSISQIEDDVEVSVCIMLVLSQRLETTVTGFVRTEDITATGRYGCVKNFILDTLHDNNSIIASIHLN